MTRTEVELNVKYSIISGIYWMICAVSGIFMVPILRMKGMDNAEIGLLMSIRSLATLGISPLIAGFSDRHPKLQLRYILMLLAGLNIVNTVFFQHFAQGFWQLLFVMIVLGGTSNTMPPLHSSIAMKFNRPGKTITYSIGRGCGSVTYAVAALALGFMVGDDHLYTALAMQIVLDVATILALFFFPNYEVESAPKKADDAKGKKSVGSHDSAYLLRHYLSFRMFCSPRRLSLSATACATAS